MRISEQEQEVQTKINSFNEGYHFGKQEMLYFLINNPDYCTLLDGEFCVKIDTLKSIMEDERKKNGIYKQ